MRATRVWRTMSLRSRSTKRALGAVFGLLRGVVVVCACVFLFGIPQSIHSSKMWQQSVLIGPAEMLIEWATPYLPDWLSEVRKGSRGV